MVTPAASAAGHACFIPRLPSRMPRRSTGIQHRKSGVMRPWVAPTASAEELPSFAAVVTGMAIAPKQTLRALPTIVTSAALIAGTPRASSMAQDIATGAPKPARPSMRPQKQKPMRSA